MNIRERLSRLLPRTDEPGKSQEPLQRGIIERNGQLRLCMPTADVRGVKLVAVTEDLLDRYNLVMGDYGVLQRQLSELPTSLRPRRVRRKEEE